jgi:peroxiredoxin Q/BCP
MSNKELNKGDKIPSFKLKDQNDEWFDISGYVGKSFLVVYFYPKDDTPGCTREACTFRDKYEDFANNNIKVIGISGDSPTSHKRFAQKHKLNFTLLSDEHQKVEKSFGVPRNLFGLLPGRVTYVIDLQGTIIHVFNSQLNVEKHVSEALRIVKTHEKAK